MDYVSMQQYAHPLRICPLARFKNEEHEFRSIQFGESPILSDAEYYKPSSSHSYHMYPLDWCNNKEDKYKNFLCGVCRDPLVGTPFYSCKRCSSYDTGYHKECVEPISKHPYHPKHSLRVLGFYGSEILKTVCSCCCSDVSYSVYNCSICDFNMCQGCARKSPVLAIDHPKRHEHTLFHFPRKSSSICDVCALSHHRSLIYSCHQCDFVVHKECVYFPYIIKISRHEHRLSFNSSLTPEKRLCGVCRGKIDTNYGRYTCVKGCSFGVHSRCATREDLWDGKELEGIPEDAHEEDIRSFNEISDGIIQHFSHQNHHMGLDKETNRAFDENKRCQACTVFIYDDIIYSCMQCDFILHQACAHLPRKKQHAMHPYPLSLQVDNQKGWFECTACLRGSNGFTYMCCERDCHFSLDVCCASISEPFDYHSHPHPLFLTSKPRSLQTCTVCRIADYTCLNCGECGFVLCFGCATLPNKLRYKHDDEHFLIFSYDKDIIPKYWCDVCEKKTNPSKRGVYYMCNDCDITVHIKCLLGEERHIKPGGIFKFRGINVNIIPNNCFTRNTCRVCNNRCQEKIVYKIADREEVLCSFECMYYCKDF